MQAPELREVQARLGPGEAVLALSIGDSTSTAWLVTSRDWTTRELAPAATLVAAIERARTRITSGASPDSAWLPLGALLVSPLAKPLAGVKRLRIVADGPLLRVPFHVLPVQPGRAGRLGDRMATSFLPACALLTHTPVPTRAGPAVLVGEVPYDEFAAVTPGGSVLHALPSTGEELASIELLVADTTTLLLRGLQANREAVLAAIEAHPSPRLLHFAVHGYASPRDPEGSCLWLAPSAEGEPVGRLGVADLRELNLSGTHVTLSACESGLGALREGEGPMGMARGFLASGASSVLASLWKVDDKATAALMTDFYEGVLHLGLSRDIALARARARALADPELERLGAWAAFVLIGATESLPLANGGGTSAR
jgi:CHAT domain-containing protein